MQLYDYGRGERTKLKKKRKKKTSNKKLCNGGAVRCRPPARLPSIRLWCAQIVQLLALDVVCDCFDENDEINEIEEHVHKWCFHVSILLENDTPPSWSWHTYLRPYGSGQVTNVCDGWHINWLIDSVRICINIQFSYDSFIHWILLKALFLIMLINYISAGHHFINCRFWAFNALIAHLQWFYPSDSYLWFKKENKYFAQ